MKKHLLFIVVIFLTGCLGMPETVTPVNGFELEKYLGKWYEIARLDHPFEKGLQQVTAQYSLRKGGGVVVTNRGYSTKNEKWNEIEGKAFFVNDPDEGYLKVSFFGPFYSSYVVFELDKENYQYAFVCGSNTSNLWLLSRMPEVDSSVMSHFIEKAREHGFNTDKLVYVKQKQ